MKIVGGIVKRLLAVLLILCFCGCAPVKPNLTRADWLNMSTHTFKKTNVNDVLTLGERVLLLADPSDVQTYHLQNKMVGSRRYLVYMVIAASFGSYNFDLTAIQKGEDVESTLFIGHSAQPVMPMVTGGEGGIGATAGAGIANIGSPIPHKDTYQLFFSRIESMLNGSEWKTCDEVRENTKNMYSEALCTLADDNIPEGAKLSKRAAELYAAKKTAQIR